jgi:mRNA interferase RelE/StbE
MAYNVSLKKRVLKALEKIDEPYYSKIKEAIYSLADNPRPLGYKKLKNIDSYRIRVADYRVIYDIIDDMLVIDVIDLGHRKEIYS